MISRFLRLASCLPLAASLAFTGCTTAATPPIAGGYRRAAREDADAIAAAKFAVAKHSAMANGRLELVAIESAETQVVAGTNWKLQLRVRAKNRVSEQVRAIVFRDLRGEYSLVSWK